MSVFSETLLESDIDQEGSMTNFTFQCGIMRQWVANRNSWYSSKMNGVMNATGSTDHCFWNEYV